MGDLDTNQSSRVEEKRMLSPNNGYSMIFKETMPPGVNSD
jgi:hypothetical protein